MIKNIIIFILVAVIAVGGFLFIESQDFGKAVDSEMADTIIGSESNLQSLPSSITEASATTTSSDLADGGAVMDQEIYTNGLRKLKVVSTLKGGTATSTFYMKVMASMDGVNYFNVPTTTDNMYDFQDSSPTTTMLASTKAFQTDPGTVTTTIPSFDIEVDGYHYMRLMPWADNLTTDPNDGVQAWIQVWQIADIPR